MPSRLFPYAFLLSLGFITTFAIQDLRYGYQDLIPNLSSGFTLKRLERLFKVRNQNDPYDSLPFPRLDDFVGKEEERQEFERQALNTALSENDIIHALPKRRQNHISNYPTSQVGDGLEENPDFREYEDRNPREFYPSFRGYPTDIRGPLTESKPQHQNAEYPTVGYRGSHHQAIREQGMKEEPDFERKYISHGQQNSGRHYSAGRIDDREETVQDFTWKFNEPTNGEKGQSFALTPNDFGYYNPEVRMTAVAAGDDFKEDERTERILSNDEKDTEPSSNELATLSDPDPFEDSSNEAEDRLVPGPERRADTYGPLVTAADHKVNNDIYFVAVVAGCSAAAMFILVLISLTWCRLQRGAKAAADVEYPAYGVTGPNKDTSPSGDRRLAQSAQMYHYQHQKQQIIAMESRTATARDHGSVSEAESDEENEEGDYTVYECPGLAPTGEMEVKNPLFHDDPTPATPAGQGQNNRSSEDHM